MTFVLPKVLAHRGANQLAPENTLGAFRLAAKHGASWLELDVMLSRDHVPIIFHDDKLERVTNGRGWVADHSLAELKALTVAAVGLSESQHSIQQDTIPTLTEFLIFLQTTEMAVNLEIKANQIGVLPTCQRALEVLHALGCETRSHRLMVSSFEREAITFFEQHAPWLPRSYLIDAYDDQNDALSFARQHGCVCVSFWHEMPSARMFLQQAQAMAMPTLCYTVDHVNEAARWIQQGVHGIFTNSIACYDLDQKVKNEEFLSETRVLLY